MDSLLASYASSEEEEEEGEERQKQQQISSSSSSLFSSLPQPSLNPTIQHNNHKKEAPLSLSSLPQPTSIPKRVVQFKPPSIKTSDSDQEDDEDTGHKRRKQSQSSSSSSMQSSSVKSFLSSIPAPRNSFSSLGGRRSIINTQPPTSTSSDENHSTSNFESSAPNAANYADYESGFDHNLVQNHASVSTVKTQPPTSSSSDAFGAENHSHSNFHTFDPNAMSYANYELGFGKNLGQNVDVGYGNYEGYEHQYSKNWGDESVTAMPETKNVGQMLGKRARNELPTEIIEVKQDELMKNRPREDQAKLTGIAFGPSYQSASTKGKPSKLHKRKHQIGSLYFDMKQKEMELAERRAKGFLTKAETQAKYGW